MGVARGGDIAVRVGLTEQVSTRERRDRGDCSNGCKNRFLCS